MNVEKLNTVIKAVIADIKGIQLQENLANAIGMLQNLMSQPNPTYQQNLSTYIKAIYEGIEKSQFDFMPPSYRQVISEISPKLLLGQNLAAQVRTILAENQVTVQTAVNELTPISNEISQFISNGTTLTQGLDTFRFGESDLEAGASEIGFLMPRSGIDSSFEKYQAQLKDFDLILRTFSEYVSGKKGDLKLRSLSSSDPLIYVGVGVSIAVAFGKAVDWLIKTYKSILEIRKLHAELKKAGVPDEKTSGIQEHANEIIQKAVVDIVEMLRKDHSGVKESARKNELESGLGICLNKIANRIDEGYGFEIRVGPLPKPRTEESEEEKTRVKQEYDEIKRVESSLSFLNLEGGKILSLPETKNGGSPTSTST